MSDRTPEEREAARRAREARRGGRPIEPDPPSAANPPPAPDPASAPDPARAPAGPPTVQWPPTAPAEPAPAPAGPPTVQWPPPAPWPAAAVPPPEAPEPPVEQPPFQQPPFQQPPFQQAPFQQAPPDDAFAFADRSSPEGRQGRPPRTRRGVHVPRDRSGAPRKRSTAARVLAVAGLVFAIVAIWFIDQLFQPFAGSGHGSVVVTVPAGASTGSIGDQLARDGVISSSFFFGLRATLDGDRGKLRAGTYRLKRGMSYSSVLSVLTTPPPAAPTTNVTIVPGRTRRQIALLLHQQGVHGRFLTDTEHTTLLNVRAYGAPRNLDNLEGFLFPSTYQVRTPISIPALVNDALTTFRQQFATVDMSYARTKNLTPYDVLIIASMVEAEAGTAHDRPLIASVIYNRLHQGMTLGIDATIRYAVNNYTAPLTASQLSSPSPYNTRTHLGLPPTPIDNPSLSSIEAAAHPANTNYLYFVAKPCGNGASAFSSTNAQFQLDVQRYDNARAQRGGRSPVAC